MNKVFFSKSNLTFFQARFFKIIHSFIFKLFLFFIFGLFSISVLVITLNYFDVVLVNEKIKGLLLISLFFELLFLNISYFLFDELTKDKETDFENMNSEEEINIADYFDIETCITMLRFDENSGNPKDLLTIILTDKRNIFILSKLGISKNEMLEVSFSESDPNKILFESLKQAHVLGKNKVDSTDIFYSFINLCSEFKDLLNAKKILPQDIENVFFWEAQYRIKENIKPQKNRDFATGLFFGYTPTLDQFCVDLTQNINLYKNELSLTGRDSEINQIENAFIKSSSKAVCLVGEPGTGKEAIVSGFAQNIYENKTLHQFKGFRVLKLDLAKSLAMDKSVGIERVMVKILREAINTGNIILFIPEIADIFSSKSRGSEDLTALMLPYISSGRLRIIGTTNNEDWHNEIVKKPQLSVLFSKIEVDSLSENETMRVLEGLSFGYEKKFRTIVTYGGIKAIISLSKKYISEAEFPGKAINLFEECLIFTNSIGKDILEREDVEAVITTKTKMPVGEIDNVEKNVLQNLEKILGSRVIGQEYAVKTIAEALKRTRAGLKSPNSPIGVFLFIGPTGVGKTELAKTLAKTYFGGEKAFTRVDMNNFKTKNSIKALIGDSETRAPSFLITQVKERPFSLILLDEFEKACQEAKDVFLQIFDEGIMQDYSGRKIDFTNTIIIATSNAGATFLSEQAKTNNNFNELKNTLTERFIKNNDFSPEMLNRFDDIVLFKPLSRESVYKITEILTKEVVALLDKKEINVEITDDAIKYLAEIGFDPSFGARPIKRVVKEKLENFLSNKMVSGDIVQGDTVRIGKIDLIGS